MKRGEVFRVQKPRGDTKKERVFVIVGRSDFILANFSTVICAPVYTEPRGTSTEVRVGQNEGLKHDSVILCDALMSVEKARLTNYVGALGPDKLIELEIALRIALAVEF